MTKTWTDTLDRERGGSLAFRAKLIDVEGHEVPQTQGANAKLPRLLLIAEDDLFRRTLARRFRSRSYEVDEALSCFQAMVYIAYQAEPYDLIISEVKLRGMSGFDLIGEVRAGRRPNDPEVPVVLLGDDWTRESARGARRLRAVALNKSYELEHLWPLVNNLVNGRRRKSQPPAPLTHAP
jgi:DNA-binding NtrC family response regulator